MSMKKIYIHSRAAEGGASRLRLKPKLKASYKVGELLPQGFVIDEVIAEGGSGLLLKAHKQHIDPPIYKAVKVINTGVIKEQSVSREDIQKEFYGEAMVSHKIGSDPYAVSVEDIIEMSDGSRALVFAFIDGHTLYQIKREHIAQGCLIPFDLVAFVCHRILSVLAHAAERGIAHRDLCPSNIMVQRTGVPMLLDWGATGMDADMLVGKPGYIAPEVVKGDGYVAREGAFKADVFSLGAVVRELLTGVNVLDAGDATSEGYDPYKVLDERAAMDMDLLKSVSQVCVDVPDGLGEIVSACLCENPADRPTAEDLYEYMGAKYLYTPQIGFGATAETLEHYLAFTRESWDPGSALPDNRVGRSLAKVISLKHRRVAESPDYREYTLKQIVGALRVSYVHGAVRRTFEDAYGVELVQRARRMVYGGLLAGRYGDPAHLSPDSLFRRELDSAMAAYEGAAPELAQGLLREAMGLALGMAGPMVDAAVNARVLRAIAVANGELAGTCV